MSDFTISIPVRQSRRHRWVFMSGGGPGPWLSFYVSELFRFRVRYYRPRDVWIDLGWFRVGFGWEGDHR